MNSHPGTREAEFGAILGSDSWWYAPGVVRYLRSIPDSALSFHGLVMAPINGLVSFFHLNLTLHKKLAKNRFAAFIAASKGQYWFFLELTMSDMARPRRKLRFALIYRSKLFFPQSFMQR